MKDPKTFPEQFLRVASSLGCPPSGEVTQEVDNRPNSAGVFKQEAAIVLHI